MVVCNLVKMQPVEKNKVEPEYYSALTMSTRPLCDASKLTLRTIGRYCSHIAGRLPPNPLSRHVRFDFFLCRLRLFSDLLGV